MGPPDADPLWPGLCDHGRDDDAACVLWVGLEVKALTTVAALQAALQAHATLPAAVAAQLEHDQAHTPPPSALQTRLLQWLSAASPQHG